MSFNETQWRENLKQTIAKLEKAAGDCQKAKSIFSDIDARPMISALKKVVEESERGNLF